MKRRFLIACGDLDKNAETALVEYFRQIGAGWWHHIPNFWLITSGRDNVTATSLRDKVKELRTTNTSPCLVMEIQEDITWAGFYKGGDTKKTTFDWIKGSWKGE